MLQPYRSADRGAIMPGLEAAGMTAELDKKVNIFWILFRSVPLHGQERNFLIQMH